MAGNLIESAESGAWSRLNGEWLQLFGSFPEDGVSVEWHDFENEETFDWGRSFHEDSLEICLNLAGRALMRRGRQATEIGERMVAHYHPCETGLRASRLPGVRHRFITIELSRKFLRSQLGDSVEHLRAPIAQFATGTRPAGRPAEVGPMSVPMQGLFNTLKEPPVPERARAVWYRAKVCEIMAELFFEAPSKEELFCTRQKRMWRERVEQVKSLLREDLESPPGLEELGRAVGCSCFHLSRVFSQQTGMTIPQFVRQVRIERAAALLVTGDYNVTEAAFAVGYSSLSHFSRAFCQITGHCPAIYAAKARA